MNRVDLLAVVVAGVAGFLLGGLWYSPLMFAKRWQAESGVSDEQVRQGSAQLLVVAILTSLVIAWAMAALLLTPGNGVISGLKRGAFAGLVWPGMSLLAINGFERRSYRLWGINAGFIVVQFAVIGAILGWMN